MNSRIQSLLALTFVLTTFNGTVQAQNGLLTGCVPKGVLIGGCTLQSTLAHEGARFDGKPFQALYEVGYRFVCQGHPVKIGIQNGGQFVPFQKTRENTIQYVRLEGTGPVRVVDLDPTFTKATALFTPNCTLTLIGNGTAYPTFFQLEAWGEESKLQAKAIRYSIDLFKLGNEWARLSDWSNTQLTNAQREIKQEMEVTTDDDTRDNLQTILGFIQNALDHKPLPPKFIEAQQSVQDVFRHRLNDEIEMGTRMVARFDAFDANREPNLVSALQSANSTSFAEEEVP